MKIIAKPVYVVIAGLLIAIALFNVSNYVMAHKIVVVETETVVVEK
jgi:hypothetical protein